MTLSEILKTLEVPRQSILYVHSSMDWLQKAGLKTNEILRTLCEWTLPAGTLVMPAYPFTGTHQAHLQTKPTYDVRRTPVRVGMLPELVRRMPQALRTLAPDYPLVLLGKDSAALAGTEVAPCEDPFGTDSVYRRVLKRKPTLIGLGVSLNTNSFIHAVDSQLEPQYPWPVYLAERAYIPCTGRDGQTWLQSRRVLRPEFQTHTKPSALVPVLEPWRGCFSSLQLAGTMFFRWDLGLWEDGCVAHAREELGKGRRPCWLNGVPV